MLFEKPRSIAKNAKLRATSDIVFGSIKMSNPQLFYTLRYPVERITMSNHMWFIVPLVIAMTYLLRTAGRNQTASRSGDTWMFGPSRSTILTVLGAVALGVTLIVGPVLQCGKLDYTTAVIGSAMILEAVAILPSVITISNDKLEAKWWWGKKVVLPWSAALSAVHDSTKQVVTVFGGNGVTIEHTKYHVDSMGFLNQVSHRVKRIAMS